MRLCIFCTAGFKAVTSRDREKLENEARELFQRVYGRQSQRTREYIESVMEGIETAGVGLIQQHWEEEPAIILKEVSDFFEEVAMWAAEQAKLPISTDYTLREPLIKQVAIDRAEWFAGAITDTSNEMTAEVIRGWLDDPTNFDDLLNRVSGVWAGSRPDVAAATEVTAIVSDAQIESWRQSEVVDGFRVLTANDRRVRPTHRAEDGKTYPLSDTTHRPPLFGDPNCRCDVAPVIAGLTDGDDFRQNAVVNQ